LTISTHIAKLAADHAEEEDDAFLIQGGVLEAPKAAEEALDLPLREAASPKELGSRHGVGSQFRRDSAQRSDQFCRFVRLHRRFVYPYNAAVSGARSAAARLRGYPSLLRLQA
jgi:hypothetical protein